MFSFTLHLLRAAISWSILTLSSSLSYASGNCDDWRANTLIPLRTYLIENSLELTGQTAELDRVKSQTTSIEEKLETNSLALNAQTEYSQTKNNLYSSDETNTNQSGMSISLSAPFSYEDHLSDKKLQKTLEKNKAYLSLLKTRQVSDAMAQILRIINLRDLLDNAQSKLPIITEQIEYYSLLNKIDSASIQELSRAELSKLKAENEISNLQSKIQVELSKFDTKNEVTSIQLDLLPEVTIPAFLTNELTCAFYDPELILKQLDTQIQKIEVEIAKSQRMPALSLSLGISSNDYHSGPHGNNYSAKLSITGPLYDGGTIKTEISDAERNYDLSVLDLSVHEKKFKKKVANFRTLERSLVRSINQADEQIQNNDEEINELIERSEAGFSVFADLSQRKLQQVELLAISIDLKGRLASFWVDYLENFSGSHLVK